MARLAGPVAGAAEVHTDSTAAFRPCGMVVVHYRAHGA